MLPALREWQIRVDIGVSSDREVKWQAKSGVQGMCGWIGGINCVWPLTTLQNDK